MNKKLHKKEEIHNFCIFKDSSIFNLEQLYYISV